MDDDFFVFRPFRTSAFFPVPDRYRSRTCARRLSNSSDPEGVGESDDSSALVLGLASGLESEPEPESAALTEKEGRGFGERNNALVLE